MTPEQHIAAHQQSGRQLSIAGVDTFVIEAGQGDAVLCLHGVPVSSYLYRKLLPALAELGLRGISYDLPGLGLSARPQDYDYSWTGLGKHAQALADALDLGRFHLVVHDIGGPVGFELAAAMPNRLASLTVLNTIIKVQGFTKPWTMRPFGVRGFGELWLASMLPAMFVQLMYLQGVSNKSMAPPDELVSHFRLLKRGDKGRAFLKIMRGFEPTEAKQQLYHSTLKETPYPVQATWGSLDPALKITDHGAACRDLIGPERFFEVPGKHFLQETHFNEIADKIAELATQSSA